MANCASSTCACTSCTQESESTVQIEHNIQSHPRPAEGNISAGPKNLPIRLVSKAGDCLKDPDGCSTEDVKSMAGSILSIRQGHDDPVFKAGGTFVEEETVMEDYDDSDESWESHRCGMRRVHEPCGERLRLWIVRALLQWLLCATADGDLSQPFENGDEMYGR